MKLFDRTLPIIISALLLLVIAQAISGALSMFSFERQQLETVISSYEAVGFNTTAKINRALALGKPLKNFIGIEKTLMAAGQKARGLDNVSVVNPSGEQLYSWQEKSPVIDPGSLFLDRAEVSFDGSRHLRAGDEHYLLFQLAGDSDQLQGYLVFSFSETSLAAKRQAIVLESGRILLVCTLVAAIVLLAGSAAIRSRAGGLGRRSLMWLVVMVLGLSQMVTSYYMIQLFRGDYLTLMEGKAETMANLLVEDIETLLHKGLRITTLFNIEKQLAGVVDSTAELGGLAIENSDGETLYRSDSDHQPSVTDLSFELAGRKGIEGRLLVGMNYAVVAKTVRAIALDCITVMLLSMLICVELLRFLLALMQAKERSAAPVQGDLPAGIGMVRAAGFLYIFAASLSISFIPLHMAALYQPVTGFSKEMILGLPLALEMLGGGIILIPAGAWIDRRGYHHPFVVGVILSLGGALGSGLAENQFHFMAARLLAGVGYGLGWMSVQGYVLQNTPIDQRARGISSVVAGIFSGIICGNGMGALIAERIGFAMVFLMGGGGMVLVLLLVLLLLRVTFTVPKVIPGNTGSLVSFFRLLRDPQALLIFLCSLVPYSIVMVGLLYYITPLFLNESGVSQSDIGRVIMLFGLSMIFIAPQVSRFADRLSDKRPLVIGGGIIGSGCLLLFYFSSAVWIVVIAVFFFGLSVAISGASRNVLTLNLPVAKEIGSSRVMGIYRSVDKLGQMLGAIVPAALMGWFSIPQTMLVMGGVYLLLTVVLGACLKAQEG